LVNSGERPSAGKLRDQPVVAADLPLAEGKLVDGVGIQNVRRRGRRPGAIDTVLLVGLRVAVDGRCRDGPTAAEVTVVSDVLGERKLKLKERPWAMRWLTVA